MDHDAYIRKLGSLMDCNQQLKNNLKDAKEANYEMGQKVAFYCSQSTELQSAMNSVIHDNKDQVALSLVEKSLKIAELSMEVEILRLQVKEQAKEKQVVEQELQANVEMMSEMNKIMRQKQSQLDEQQQKHEQLQEVQTDPNHKQFQDLKTKLQLAEQEKEKLQAHCTALMETVSTLKAKNAQREVKTLMSLKHMSRQIDMLEQNKRRQNEAQSHLEEKVDFLKNENQMLRGQILAMEQKVIFIVQEKSLELKDQRRQQYPEAEEPEREKYFASTSKNTNVNEFMECKMLSGGPYMTTSSAGTTLEGRDENVCTKDSSSRSTPVLSIDVRHTPKEKEFLFDSSVVLSVDKTTRKSLVYCKENSQDSCSSNSDSTSQTRVLLSSSFSEDLSSFPVGDDAIDKIQSKVVLIQ